MPDTKARFQLMKDLARPIVAGDECHSTSTGIVELDPRTCPKAKAPENPFESRSASLNSPLQCCSIPFYVPYPSAWYSSSVPLRGTAGLVVEKSPFHSLPGACAMLPPSAPSFADWQDFNCTNGTSASGGGPPGAFVFCGRVYPPGSRPGFECNGLVRQSL
jgi:hypothetical protein